ncbi:MAG: cytochrome C [Hyphomicrobium sp.]|jgi:cytochrome c|nr:cytochrome C [Hyphomicrobium sp.]PPD06433.1 MAG: cytochrome C [Hyphomicrobium sp.]
MDSFEMSKMAGAVLAALLLIVATNVIVTAKTASSPNQPVAGYKLPTDTATAEAPAGEAKPAETAEAPAAAAKDGAAAPANDGAAAPAKDVAAAPAKDAAAPAPAAGGFDAKAVVAMLASAKAEDGAAKFKACAACHQVKKDAPSAVAPNLWGIVNRPKAAQADFAAKYSEAMKAKGGEWTYENLALFLHKPKDYVPGTKMVYNGIKDPAEIASVVAYLRTLADAPAPLPN